MGEISSSRSLHRLVYASAQAPADNLDELVGDIIRVSIARNREVAITGLLLVHAGAFVQALEGPAEAVLTTYGRICNDSRHRDAKVLQAGPAEARAFGDWNMCARNLTPSDNAILDALGLRQSFEPLRLSGRAALSLLKAVRGIQDRTQRTAMR